MKIPPEQPKRGIQSIEIGFKLLEVLAEGRGRLPLKDLAAAANMAPSKAYLYLVSFMRLGLVEQDRATSRYSLGPSAIRLGISAINQTDLIEVARRYIDDAVSRSGVSISVSVWANHGPTIVFRRDGAQPVPISIRLGFVLPLLSTATGKVFLAHQPESVWMQLALQEESLQPGLLSKVRDEMPQIRRRRYACTDSQMRKGFFGVSSPVMDGGGTICAAVTALGLSGSIDLSDRGPVVSNVVRLAQQISTDLGHL